MDLNALRLFVDIVDAGNLSAAARKLKMTRANVSYRLKALEEELGVQLLRRTTRHVEPTPVGAGLYEHGRNILGEVAAANALISNMGKSLQGHVRLSVPTGLGHSLLSPLLVRFKQRYPDITLDVVFDNRVHNLVSEDVEVALRIISTPPDSVVATEIGAVDWIVCAAPAYLAGHPAPQALAGLQAHAIVCASPVGQKLKASGSRAGGNDDEVREQVVLEPTLSSENFAFLKEAVLAGLGVGIFPIYAIGAELDSGALVPLLSDYRISVFGSKLYMLTMPNRYQTLATRYLLNFLKTELQAVWPRLHR
ncbi:LysR family transcriptional regulator [Cupriavidus alkaliphilus]|uniref:DNA-binding transcriptional LysR family regulator n=1 Tax=Cupriavidus alkaliphilus TaxID=942866 RepID=A0A7W4YR76_9BURK|nr:LysR family transcriptional regulator [Cupriavidus alkaliphilus]MBB2920164.1 DNA-binding transcriptional LysR family regulator [Cupriavidus alkaliphilus]MBB3006766.1 DNA-binding transcriptional LysR family regulator [Cupriavidus alkaliphilus]MBB3014662.1 DNA-binding transcriptional LysR family regulator [Cupriavidus alkaliphilus]PVY76702.1 LysR family transcriptional regulator [Cupriavidus alkaliphilus]